VSNKKKLYQPLPVDGADFKCTFVVPNEGVCGVKAYRQGLSKGFYDFIRGKGVDTMRAVCLYHLNVVTSDYGKEYQGYE
jgi:hypothetical protein